MRHFIIKASVFAFAQTLVFLVLIFAARKKPDTYIAAIIDKHVIAKRTPDPRIVLVGGSNLAFGMHSQILEEKLRRHPVNLGLHAALGLPFMLSDALTEIRKGDFVVLSIEYGLLLRPNPTREYWEALLWHPSSAAYLSYKQISDEGLGFMAHVANRGRKTLLGQFRGPTEGLYRRASFNEYGDVSAHWNQGPVRPFIYDQGTEPDPTWEASDLLPNLKTFVATCEGRGARVFIFFPPIPEDTFELNRIHLVRHVEMMRSAFGDRVLGRVGDIPLPRAKFYDTPFHLLGPAGEARTSLMADRILAATQ